MVLPFLGFVGLMLLMGLITGFLLNLSSNDFEDSRFLAKNTRDTTSTFENLQNHDQKEYKTVYLKNPNTGIAYATQVEVEQKATPQKTTINGVTTLPNGVTILTQ